MADMERVKYSIERCISHVPDACKDCAYDAGHPYNECVEMMLNDVLALLKEQDAVEPIKKDTVEITARYEFDCPCGAPLLVGQPYCADCGRSVKWE